MFVKHTSYVVGEAFDEHVQTVEVCRRGVHPLLSNVMAGGCSTLFMYGQTGSGKTHTMSGIEQYASAVLLPDAESAEGEGAAAPGEAGGDGGDGGDSERPAAAHLSFFEIC